MSPIQISLVVLCLICGCEAFLMYPAYCSPVGSMYVDPITRTGQCLCKSGFQYDGRCMACNHNFMYHQIPDAVFPDGTPLIDCASIFTQHQCETGTSPQQCPPGCRVEWSGVNFETCVRSDNLPLRYDYPSQTFSPECNPGDFLIMSNIMCESFAYKRDEHHQHNNQTKMMIQVLAFNG